MPLIPRPADLVLVTWQRNPLHPHSRRRIVAVRVIGSASPCVRFLAPGLRLSTAIRCLLNNGFRIVCSKKTSSVSGFFVLQRH
jgi:hypothetical protein